jgi:hypothetical protein
MGRQLIWKTEMRKWIEWACIPEMDGMWECRIKARILQVQENKEVIRMTWMGMTEA